MVSQTKILILDYSVDKSEATAVRRWLPAESEVTAICVDTEDPLPDGLIERGFTHVIHSGSSLSIVEEAPFTRRAVALVRSARDRGLAQFGICYGHQLVCLALVGKSAVRSSPNGLEAGWGTVTFTPRGRQVLGVGERERIWQSHLDEVVAMPEGSHLVATNAHSEIQAYINHRQRILGTQFHPEFDKQAGDRLFLQDREFLARHGLDADDLVAGGPSIDAGRVFFGCFVGGV